MATSVCYFRLWGLTALRSTSWATLAFERGVPATAFDVHLQDRGVVHEPIDRRQREARAAALDVARDQPPWLAIGQDAAIALAAIRIPFDLLWRVLAPVADFLQPVEAHHGIR